MINKTKMLQPLARLCYLKNLDTLGSAVVSSGASGAMVPPLFCDFTMELTENCFLENSVFSNGTTGFGNLTTTLISMISLFKAFFEWKIETKI